MTVTIWDQAQCSPNQNVVLSLAMSRLSNPWPALANDKFCTGATQPSSYPPPPTNHKVPQTQMFPAGYPIINPRRPRNNSKVRSLLDCFKIRSRLHWGLVGISLGRLFWNCFVIIFGLIMGYSGNIWDWGTLWFVGGGGDGKREGRPWQELASLLNGDLPKDAQTKSAEEEDLEKPEEEKIKAEEEKKEED